MRSKRSIATLLACAILFTAGLNPALAQEQPQTSATGLVRGTLVDANGQALVGYRLKLVGADGMVHESEPTGADGKYEIKDLPPGTYSYEILDTDGNTVPVRIPPVRLEAGMLVTQPIAIVPRRGRKGPAIAWALGGAGVVIGALIIANGNDGGKKEPSMSPSGT